MSKFTIFYKITKLQNSLYSNPKKTYKVLTFSMKQKTPAKILMHPHVAPIGATPRPFGPCGGWGA